MMSAPRARILITPGEPAGIGPDLVIQLAQQGFKDEVLVVASQELLQQRARILELPLQVIPYDDFDNKAEQYEAGTLRVLDVPLTAPVTAGQLDTQNGPYVLKTLRRAVQLCQEHGHTALVTGPIHKGNINAVGIPFTGHTEFLAEQTGSPQVVMMLACPGLRVALATTHLPLAEVSRAITAEKLRAVLEVLHHDLQRDFGLSQPNILVCGLNPHAGEDGHLGREEQTIIEPVLQELRQRGMKLQGPLPADTLFIPKTLRQADAVLAMYHDQGLPVLKHMGFGRAVNITLGLPFVRTSVDHGTALDLAGSGDADLGSLETALTTARQMLAAQQAMCEQA